MKMVKSLILNRLQRHFAPKDGFPPRQSGVRIEERRWRRAIESLDRECETLRRRIGQRF